MGVLPYNRLPDMVRDGCKVAPLRDSLRRSLRLSLSPVLTLSSSPPARPDSLRISPALRRWYYSGMFSGDLSGSPGSPLLLLLRPILSGSLRLSLSPPLHRRHYSGRFSGDHSGSPGSPLLLLLRPVLSGSLQLLFIFGIIQFF